MLAIPFPNIDPALVSVELFGIGFSLRWYALAYVLGLILGWRLMVRLVRRPALWPRGAPMTPEQPEELLTWMVVGVVLGGRLGFVLFYQPSHFLAHPAEILQVWNGGMSFHGGFLGVILGTVLYCRAKALPVLTVGDLVALAAPIGLLLGRVANFINAELWGRVTDMPWGVVFPGAGPLPRHPSQLYEAVLEGAVLFLVLWRLGVGRGWLGSRPGGLVGVFLIGYGLARTLVETVRQPDALWVAPGNPTGHALQIAEGAGLTMGQILSLPMILVGLGFLWLSRRRAAQA